MPDPVEPFTVAQAKARLRIVADDRDDEVAQLCLSARHHIEHHCEQVFTTPRAVAESLRAFTTRPIRLRTRPIIEVDSIDYLDSDGAAQAVDGADIRLLNDGHGFAIVPMPALGAWPPTYHLGANVQVNLTAGYPAIGGGGPDATLPAVPPEIVTAMMMMVRHLFDNPAAVVVGTIASELPLGVRALCAPHRLAF